jgi:competence protein ComEA
MFTTSFLTESTEIFNRFKTKDWLAITGVTLGLGLALLGCWWLLQPEWWAPSSTENPIEEEVQILPPVSAEPDPQPTLTVEVSGAVTKPGVYHFHPGDRVVQALQAAGGLAPDASQTFVHQKLNLAQLLTDETKIYVPFTQEELTNPTGFRETQTNGQAETGLTSINQGSQSELEELPDIGKTRALKIIENRPYSQIEELVTRRVVSQSLFDKLKPFITL